MGNGSLYGSNDEEIFILSSTGTRWLGDLGRQSRHPGGLLPVVQRALGLAEFVSDMSELARQAGAVYTGMP